MDKDNQFEDKFDESTYYKVSEDTVLLNNLWTNAVKTSGSFVGIPNSGLNSFDDNDYLSQDYLDNNNFSPELYNRDDLANMNFFRDDNVSMVLYNNPFDYINLRLEKSDTNYVKLEKIQTSIVSPGITSSNIAIASSDIKSILSYSILPVDVFTFNVNTLNVGYTTAYNTIVGYGTTSVVGYSSITFGRGDTNVFGDFTVNVNQFTVDSSTGDTYVNGDLVVNANKFGVDSVTGDAYIDGNLEINGCLNVTEFCDYTWLNTYLSSSPVGVSTLLVGVAGTTIITTADGLVGIGTTVPQAKLHVVGNTLITGIATVGLGTTSSPANSQLSFDLTSNTNLRIRVRGTDGVMRTANITLT
jgi:hypothetical protein